MDLRFSALAPKLAALAHWQECVLNNALVARMRMHTGGSTSVAVPTASQFVEQSCVRPTHAPRGGAGSGGYASSSGFNAVSAGGYSTGYVPAPMTVVPNQPMSGKSIATHHQPAQMIGGLMPAYSQRGFVGPRQFSLDNKIEMFGGGANVHERRKMHEHRTA